MDKMDKVECTVEFTAEEFKSMRKPEPEQMTLWPEITEVKQAEAGPMPVTYRKQIEQLLAEQEAKGVKKYGHILDYNNDGIIQRLQHLERELIDALMYIQWIKDIIPHTRINI